MLNFLTLNSIYWYLYEFSRLSIYSISCHLTFSLEYLRTSKTPEIEIIIRHYFRHLLTFHSKHSTSLTPPSPFTIVRLTSSIKTPLKFSDYFKNLIINQIMPWSQTQKYPFNKISNRPTPFHYFQNAFVQNRSNKLGQFHLILWANSISKVLFLTGMLSMCPWWSFILAGILPQYL